MLYLLVGFVVWAGCATTHKNENRSVSISTAEEPTSRLFGIAVGPSSQDYSEALKDSAEAGSQIFEIPQQWREYELAENRQLLAMLNRLVPSQSLKAVLTLNPLDTSHNQIPDSLRELPYDAPEMIESFTKFVDSTFERLPDVEILSVAVGNEVDILLGDGEEDWASYTRFFEQARLHIRKTRPQLPVGVKITYNGLHKYPERSRRLIEKSDLVMLTYYPIDADRVRPVEAVSSDLKWLCENFPKKRIQLNELGYPSSAALGSSEQIQADFTKQALEAWDGLPQIELMNFVWLNEMTPTTVKQLKSEFAENAPIVNFLSTLGLRDHHGKPKPAFLRLVAEWKKRR